MKNAMMKIGGFIAAITVWSFTDAASATDLVDCKDPTVQKLVLQEIEDWWLLQGYPKSPISYSAFMPTYAKSTSPGSMALKRKLEGEWNTELTFCETKTIPDDGNIFMLTGFTTTDSSGRVGGFIANFGAGGAIATFGGFDENLLK